MKPTTIQALDRINQRFYSAGASEFHQTRSGPWKGWSLVVERLGLQNRKTLRVLDVGCGNGRFATYLSRSCPNLDLHYLGLDSSNELLAAARMDLETLDASVDLRQINLLGDAYQGCPCLTEEASTFDLVVSFGVLHHIPADLQGVFMARCLEACAPGGTVCTSLWQFGTLERFQQRRLAWSWAAENQLMTEDQIDELDELDWLLPWGQKSQQLARYCRFNTPDAIAQLLSALASTSTPQFFSADGATGTLNLYALLEEPA